MPFGLDIWGILTTVLVLANVVVWTSIFRRHKKKKRIEAQNEIFHAATTPASQRLTEAVNAFVYRGEGDVPAVDWWIDNGYADVVRDTVTIVLSRPLPTRMKCEFYEYLERALAVLAQEEELTMEDLQKGYRV